MPNTTTSEELNKGLTSDSNTRTENVEHQVENKMIPEKASVDQLDADATKNEELANEQAPVEKPTEAPGQAESDPNESAAHAGDGTTELTDAEKLAFLQDVENLPTLITMMSFLPKFIRKRLVIRISYRAAAKEGIVMVYSNVNRQIDIIKNEGQVTEAIVEVIIRDDDVGHIAYP